MATGFRAGLQPTIKVSVDRQVVDGSVSGSSWSVSDITLTGTTGAVTSLVKLTETSYRITVTGMTNGDVVTVTMRVGQVKDLAGNENTAGIGAPDNIVTYDSSVPTGTVFPPEASTNTSPGISGTVSDPDATITVRIPGLDGISYDHTFPAINNGTNWVLAAGTIAPRLQPGNYRIVATFKDTAGNTTEAETTLRALDETTDIDSGADVAVPPTRPPAPTGASIILLLGAAICTILISTAVLWRSKWRHSASSRS